MNGSSAVNEQFIVKFHVVHPEKLPSNSDESACNLTQQTPTITDESTCASRFQMIRVDRNFGRGRWKVNDYEPPENTTSSTLSTIDNESTIMSNTSTGVNPSVVMSIAPPIDVNVTPAATLASTASVIATAFQQQRLPMNNTPMVLPPANIPSPAAALLHAYPPGTLPNMTTPNQSYMLPNHHQFGYYPFYPHPYSAYAAQWAALAAANPYLPPPPPMVSLPPSQQVASATLNDPLRLTETDINNDNPVISSNSTTDHLSNGPICTTPFLYAPHHSHSPYVPQHSTTTASPYATIPSYHPVASLPTIIPPTQSFPMSQLLPHTLTDLSQNHQPPSQHAPGLLSPKHELTKTLIQHPALIITPRAKPVVPTTTISASTNITDLISSSPSLTSFPQAPVSLLSPITATHANTANPTGTSLTDIWAYTNAGSPLNLTKTANTTAVVTTEITNEILKELTTPTKQNNTTDIDNKISAAMDLVKMHLLSAVREEVTELRQQIRTLTDKVNSIEHENVFLRQYVPSELYAQYTPIPFNLSSSNESSNPQIPSSQLIPMTCPTLLAPASTLLPQHSSFSSSMTVQLPVSSTNTSAI